MRKCPMITDYCFRGIQTIKRQNKAIVSVLVLLLCSLNSYAAGPKMGQFYLNLGGGAFGPQFTLRAGSIDGPPGQIDISVILPGSNGNPVPLIGLETDTTTDILIKPENRDMISLGAVFGYQITDEFGAELGLDLSMIEIDVQNLYIIQDILPGNPESINIQILPPDLLPITFSGIYTLFPSSRVSPYIGFGAMLALLDNRRANSVATDVVVIDGGIELGYIMHAGIKMDISEGMYAFADFKYGRVSNPSIDDRFGTAISVEKFEVRHMRFGVGYPI
ncbi:MAG: hypothetical protein JKY01_02100 [Pseudomonadales bacterium]|nr:hypothetical protein [Pseudomonadales bacterium]